MLSATRSPPFNPFLKGWSAVKFVHVVSLYAMRIFAGVAFALALDGSSTWFLYALSALLCSVAAALTKGY